MWPSISYFLCYCIYIFSYITFWQDGPVSYVISGFLMPALIGIMVVFPAITLFQLINALTTHFGGNKYKAKPNFMSVMCNLFLTVISYSTLYLGYFPAV